MCAPAGAFSEPKITTLGFFSTENSGSLCFQHKNEDVVAHLRGYLPYGRQVHEGILSPMGGSPQSNIVEVLSMSTKVRRSFVEVSSKFRRCRQSFVEVSSNLSTKLAPRV